MNHPTPAKKTTHNLQIGDRVLDNYEWKEVRFIERNFNKTTLHFSPVDRRLIDGVQWHIVGFED